MRTRLVRSRKDRMIGGVCGGIARYMGIDSTLARLFFVLLALGSGVGIFLYLVLWILVPEEGLEEELEPASAEPSARRAGAEEFAERTRAMGDDLRQAVRNPNPQAGLIIGGALVLLGIVYLVDNLNLPWLWWLEFDVLWPILLVLGGIALILRYQRQKGG